MQRRFVYLKQWVLGIPKHPHLPETELYYRWNVDFTAMVQVGMWKESNFSRKKKKIKMDLVGIPYVKEGFGRPVHQKTLFSFWKPRRTTSMVVKVTTYTSVFYESVYCVWYCLEKIRTNLCSPCPWQLLEYSTLDLQFWCRGNIKVTPEQGRSI